MKIERDNCLRLQCEVKTNDHWVSFLGYHFNFSYWWTMVHIFDAIFFLNFLKLYLKNLVFIVKILVLFKTLIFLLLVVLVSMIWLHLKPKIVISIFSLGKGRILAASACPCWEEGRAREGKDACTCTSTLVLLFAVPIMMHHKFPIPLSG